MTDHKHNTIPVQGAAAKAIRWMAEYQPGYRLVSEDGTILREADIYPGSAR